MPELQAGMVIAGKYRLLERVSEGGMGSVWRALHGQLDAVVALKFMHAKLLNSSGARARFEREAKAAAQIQSPYVVAVHDHGIDDQTGMPFIVMEFLHGEDLAQRIAVAGPLAAEEAVRICSQVCKGLARAHEADILHRDLKPANIFLCAADDDMVKILDFGLAKDLGGGVIGGDMTTVGQVLGSPRYMSPEQTRNQPLDRRSDLWSLAVVMFRSLTGKPPFNSNEMVDLAVRICTDPVPRVSDSRPELGAAVDGFFDRAFERDPDGRFQTAEAFASHFEAAVLGAAVLAPDGPPETSAPRAAAKFTLPKLSGPDVVVPTAAASGEPPMAAPQPMVAPVAATPALRRIVRPAAEEPEKRPVRRKGEVVFGAGVILAGLIILFFSEGGELDLGFAARRVGKAVTELADHATGGAASASASPTAVGSSERLSAAWRTVYQQVQTGEIPQAVESLAKLLEMDPDALAAKHHALIDLTERAVDRGDPTRSRMLKLITEKMGAHGPDLLFDVMTTRKASAAAKEARRLLTGAKLRSRGSKDMQRAYAIHTASECRAKGLILVAKRDGGARVLREIKELSTHCMATERCCIKGDKAVQAVAKAIEARL